MPGGTHGRPNSHYCVKTENESRPSCLLAGPGRPAGGFPHGSGRAGVCAQRWALASARSRARADMGVAGPNHPLPCARRSHHILGGRQRGGRLSCTAGVGDEPVAGLAAAGSMLWCGSGRLALVQAAITTMTGGPVPRSFPAVLRIFQELEFLTNFTVLRHHHV